MLRVMAYTKNLTDLSYHPNLSYFFYLEGCQSYTTQNHPPLPLYSDSLKLHLMKSRTVRADSLRSQSVAISLV